MARIYYAQRFGVALERERRVAGLSEAELAEKLDVTSHPAAIAWFERGKLLPSLETFVAIVNALGVKPEDLL